jgi:Uma2 family endonuclease
MSTVSGRPTRGSQPPTVDRNPFRYGWRYVRNVRPDGTEEIDQVPLTLEDVLHPEAGDVIVESYPHNSDRDYLKAVFRTRLPHERTAAVFSDCQVDFNIPGVKPICPDVVVFFDIRRQAPWSSFDVAAEGARPVLVVEITSPDTRSNDIGTKKTYYYRAKVPWYVIADVRFEGENERRIELLLYRRTGAGYRRVKPDESGRVWLEPVGLWLGQVRDRIGGFMRLACFDPETGEEVGDYTAISQALADAQRLLDEEARARGEAEKALADEARARGEAEKALAEALARIQQLESSQRTTS